MMNRMRSMFVLDPVDWRAGMLALVLKVITTLGFLVYVPSAWFAWQLGLKGIVVADTIAMIAFVILHFLKSIPFRTRAIAFGVVSLLLGLALMHWAGLVAQIYLIALSVLMTLLLGARAGLVSVGVNTSVMLAMGLTGNIAHDPTASLAQTTGAAWWVIALNFTLVSHLVVAGIAVALRALDRARQNEVELRESQNHDRLLLRALFDTLPDAVFTKDLSGHYIQANRAALEQSGHATEQDLLGKSVYDMHPKEVADATQRDDERVIAGNVISNREVQLTRPDGLRRWYVSLKAPLRNDEGTITGLVGVTRDITDRKQAEFERDRHLRQLELQIERMPIAYILTDANLDCRRWNPAAEAIFGYSQDEVLGRNVFDLIVGDSQRARADRVIAQVRSGRMDVSGEFINVNKEGAAITCEWHNTPMFDDDGKFAGLLSLTFDISARKKLESQLLQSQKMEAIGQLAGGVAHDFNNLLTVIFGYSELLLSDPHANALTRSSVKSISEAAQRAAGLTGQLLAFSRKTMLQPKVLDINAVVTETSTMLRRMIGEDVTLTTQLASQIQLVRVDPVQLSQVLMNLAVNARDAMPQGGNLSIETQNVELSADYASTHPDTKAGPHVMLAITDSGTGMPPEVMAHIFEPFFTTKAVGSGTGLGLATVFGIVRQSGGSINVYSEPGIGTTFKIYFPSLSGAVAMESGGAPTEAKGGAETVLLVEDDDAVRRLATTALKRFGYNVIAASTANEAMTIIAEQSESINVLLTDVVMPGMSGPQLVLALRDKYPQLKAVFMSGYTDDAVVRHGLLAAEVSFLQKPFTPAGLATKIRQVLDGQTGI
jgi:two-component system cell cycle sensor histidine kinase/response regulator CckA